MTRNQHHGGIMRNFRLAEQFSLIYQFFKYYRTVHQFPYLSQDTIRAYQFARIKQLLNIAYYHTAFYRRKYDAAGIHPEDIKTWDDFAHLPTVTKDEVIGHELDMVDNRRSIKDLILSRSSGSGGKFVDIYLDAQNFITQELQVIRMLKEFYPDYSPFDKELLVYTSEYPFRSIGGLYQVQYVNNLLSAEHIFAAMQRLRPVIVAIYPSILKEIVRVYGEQVRKLGIRAVITNSEHSSQAERDQLAAAVGCPVFDEFSSEEVSGIAYQCHQKQYHLVQDSAYVEILDPERDTVVPPGDLGEIVGTCLINTAMPFIRYRQSDLAIMGTTTCSCGKTAPIFHELSGRKVASFKKPDQTYIPSGRILDWTYSLVLNLGCDIREFQVIQRDFTDIEIAIVPGESYTSDQFDSTIVTSFQETFSRDFDVTVSLVPYIEKTSAGKHIPIRSYI
jgi:phenylacetate-CoA ligase